MGDSIGNIVYRVVCDSRWKIFEQGEIAQLTHIAFNSVMERINSDEKDTIDLKIPVGWRSGGPVNFDKSYTRDHLKERYEFLQQRALCINGLVQLVTIIEAMFGDLVRAVVTKYPKKLGQKRTIPLQSVLESSSITELHMRAADTFVNELSYKSPVDYAESAKEIFSVDFWECPAFHRYVELKASRDLFVHGHGIANDIYVKKARGQSRVQPGHQLPADQRYFMESYEACLQFTDWLEEALHETWHSSEYEERQKPAQLEMKLPEHSVEPSGTAEAQESSGTLPSADSNKGPAPHL